MDRTAESNDRATHPRRDDAASTSPTVKSSAMLHLAA